MFLWKFWRRSRVYKDKHVKSHFTMSSSKVEFMKTRFLNKFRHVKSFLSTHIPETKYIILKYIQKVQAHFVKSFTIHILWKGWQGRAEDFFLWTFTRTIKSKECAHYTRQYRQGPTKIYKVRGAQTFFERDKRGLRVFLGAFLEEKKGAITFFGGKKEGRIVYFYWKILS